MAMPSRPGIFAKLRGEFPGGMTDLLFWERIIDMLVQEEVDIVLRRWIYRVHNIPEVLDTYDLQELQVGAAQAPRTQANTPPRGKAKDLDIIRRRQELAEDAKREIAAVLERWALEVETLEFLNIQLDKEYMEDLRFEHHAELRRKQYELDANQEFARLNAQAEAQAEAIRRAITAVGEAVAELRKQGIEPSEEEISQMTHAAMQELTLIFRLNADVQARLDPTEEHQANNGHGQQ
jgi:hypothetical protein